VGINQLQLENVKQIKHFICIKQVQTFLLSLFPKQYDRTAATSIDIAVGIMGNPEMT
jgi:hypothetical protein